MSEHPQHPEPITLVAPNGRPIVGELQSIQGVARVYGYEPEKIDGQWVPLWTGDTDVFYDATEAATGPDGETLLLDDRGNAWLGRECRPQGHAQDDPESELLEAAKEARTVLEGTTNAGRATSMDRDALARLEAAIARAEGADS